jgi:hypothetical protein
MMRIGASGIGRVQERDPLPDSDLELTDAVWVADPPTVMQFFADCGASAQDWYTASVNGTIATEGFPGDATVTVLRVRTAACEQAVDSRSRTP